MSECESQLPCQQDLLIEELISSSLIEIEKYVDTITILNESHINIIGLMADLFITRCEEKGLLTFKCPCDLKRMIIKRITEGSIDKKLQIMLKSNRKGAVDNMMDIIGNVIDFDLISHKWAHPDNTEEQIKEDANAMPFLLKTIMEHVSELYIENGDSLLPNIIEEPDEEILRELQIANS